jgi:hypothetical protein
VAPCDGQVESYSAAHSVIMPSVNHDTGRNLFRLRRHLLRAAFYRLLRDRSFREWSAVTES